MFTPMLASCLFFICLNTECWTLGFVEFAVLVWVSELLFWLPFSCCHWMYSVNAIKETIDWTHYCLISPPTAISLPAERVYSETGDNKGDLLPLLSFISPLWTSLLTLSYLPSINFGPSPPPSPQLDVSLLFENSISLPAWILSGNSFFNHLKSPLRLNLYHPAPSPSPHPLVQPGSVCRKQLSTHS